MSEAPDVVVVGAGMAGLRCALELRARGLEPLVLEAADAVGGRVRTDEIDGFLIDRGFQVLLTAYPEARAIFDYPALDLRPFFPGALCRRLLLLLKLRLGVYNLRFCQKRGVRHKKKRRALRALGVSHPV